MSILTVLGLVMDLGLSPLFIRESSKNIDSIKKYLGATIGIKIILCPLGVISALYIVWLTNYPAITKQLLYMIIFMMVLDSFSMTFFGCFRAKQRLEYEAKSMIIGHLLMLVLGVYFLFSGYEIQFLILAVLFSSIFNFIYSLYSILFTLKIYPKILYNWSVTKQFLNDGFPFFISSIIGIRVVDTLILSYYSDMESVALFGLPASVVRGLQLIPIALIAAVYPQMSYLNKKSPEKLGNTFKRSAYSLGIFVLPLVILLVLLSPDILISIYGKKFNGSVLPLQILSLSLIPIFFNYLIATLLNACDKQVINMVLQVVTSILHIALCFILIPTLNAIGAAIVGFASNAILFSLGSYWVIKELKKKITWYLSDIIRISTAGALMAILVYCLKNYLYFIYLFPIAVSGFVLFLFIIEKLTLKINSKTKIQNMFYDLYNAIVIKF